MNEHHERHPRHAPPAGPPVPSVLMSPWWDDALASAQMLAAATGLRHRVSWCSWHRLWEIDLAKPPLRAPAPPSRPAGMRLRVVGGGR